MQINKDLLLADELTDWHEHTLFLVFVFYKVLPSATTGWPSPHGENMVMTTPE